MTRAGSKWCSTCRATYRGSYGVHAGTQRHRRAARGSADSGVRLKPKKRYSAPRENTYSDMLGVRAHRRRRPLDGPRRDVKVRRYWRGAVQRWVHIPMDALERARRYVR